MARSAKLFEAGWKESVRTWRMPFFCMKPLKRLAVNVAPLSETIVSGRPRHHCHPHLTQLNNRWGLWCFSQDVEFNPLEIALNEHQKHGANEGPKCTCNLNQGWSLFGHNMEDYLASKQVLHPWQWVGLQIGGLSESKLIVPHMQNRHLLSETAGWAQPSLNKC